MSSIPVAGAGRLRSKAGSVRLGDGLVKEPKRWGGPLFHVKPLYSLASRLGGFERLERVVDPDEGAPEQIARPSLEGLLLATRRLDLMSERHRRQQHRLRRHGPSLRDQLGELRAHGESETLEILFRRRADDTVALTRDTQLDSAAIHAPSVTGWFATSPGTPSRRAREPAARPS